ncbi:MAG: hypothetical protein WAT25_12830 [Paracoccaceae bacterium]
MNHTVKSDREFLTNEDSFRRFWMGPHDPDPTVARIGAVQLGLAADFPPGPRFMRLVRPKDRHGNRVALHPAFTSLTSIAQADGKDELGLMTISSRVAGIPTPCRRSALAMPAVCFCAQD